MALRFIYIILIFFTLLCSACKETSKNTLNSANVITAVSQQKQQTKPVTRNKFEILEVLSQIDLQPFPQALKAYLDGNKLIKLTYIDNKSINLVSKLSNYSISLKIRLLERYNDNYIFFISSIRQDSLNYRTYFYVLQYFNKKFENITLYVFPEELIQIFNLTLETNFHFTKLGTFWAYISGNSQYALDFDFYEKVGIVKQCFLHYQSPKQKCKPLLKLTWNGQQFAYSLIQQWKTPKGFLTDEQLDKVKRYNDLDDALLNYKQVYILDLSGQGLKFLPPEIGHLNMLQVLILSNNYLDSLPDAIGQLYHLQVLRADNNRLNTIPKSIGQLFYLQDLNLSHNKINNLPYEFANLKNLQKLDLASNNLSVLAFDMSGMQHLLSINLSRNKFEKIPYQIFKVKSLTYLDISYNPVRILPRELIDMQNLKYLIIKHTLIDSGQVHYLKLKRPDLQIVK